MDIAGAHGPAGWLTGHTGTAEGSRADRPLEALAQCVARVWAPRLGLDVALEAARNVVTPLALAADLAPSLRELAVDALSHRRARFGLVIDDESIAALAEAAGRIEEARHGR